MWEICLGVDDNNEPDMENIPKYARKAATSTIGQGWGCMGIDNRRSWNNHNVKSILNEISYHAFDGVSVVSMFLVFYPSDILENIVLVETNKSFKKEKLEVASFGEFLQ